MLKIWIKTCKQSAVILLLSATLAMVINSLRPDRLALDTNWSSTVLSSPISSELSFISLEEAKQNFISNTALFIDARSTEDYHQGHIKGALNLPFDGLHEQFINMSEKLPANHLLITYCDGESCHLSHELARFLIDNGFNQVRVLINGWTLWENNHLPIDRETGSRL